VSHAYQVVKFGLPIRTRAEVDRSLGWMKAAGLAASTQSTILSTIRSVQPRNEPLLWAQLKVPARSVQAWVLSREEIKSVLDDLALNGTARHNLGRISQIVSGIPQHGECC